MRTSFSPRIHWMIVWVFVCASVGAFIPAFRFAGENPVFTTSATLRVEGGRALHLAQDRAEWGRLEFKVNDELQSPELERKAREGMMRSLPPTLSSCEVVVLAYAEPATSTFFITARGTDAVYVPSYLSFLLDAFVSNHALEQDKNERWSIVEPVCVPIEEKHTWLFPLLTGVLRGGVFGGLIALLLEWRRHRAMRTQIQLAAASNDPHTIGSASANIMAEGKGTAGTTSRSRSSRPATAWAWMVAGGVLMGLLFQIVRVASTPLVFRSLGKVAILDEENPGFQTDTHRAMIAFLESEELSRRTLERMRLRFSELKPRNVDISVRQPRGSSHFYVLAQSGEPSYTQLFLDLLLDEFSVADHPFGKVVVQERATVAAEQTENWNLPLTVGVIVGGFIGIVFGGLCWLIRRIRESRSSLSDCEATA